MYSFLTFIFLLVLTLSDQNCESDINYARISNNTKCGTYAFNRHPRSAPGKIDKPMACKKLSGTEDTPFMAIILNRASGRLICMGSIIDDKHVLTAYKCVQSTTSKSLRVLLGYFKAYWGRHSQVLYVEKILKHEHDIVILRLQRSIVFSRTVKPIQLLRLEDDKADEGAPAAKGRGQNSQSDDADVNIEEDENELDADKKSEIEETETETEDSNSTLESLDPSVTFNDSNVSQYHNNSEIGEVEDMVEPEKNIRKRVLYGNEKGASWKQGGKPEEPKPKFKLFTETHPDVKEFFLVGFPLSHLDSGVTAFARPEAKPFCEAFFWGH